MKIKKEYSIKSIDESKSLQIADELNVMGAMRKQIHEGDYVCRCPLCKSGFICETDALEKIGYCDYCFEEFKLS